MGSVDKLLVLEEFFAQRLWFLAVGEGRRIIGCTLKVEPSGYLAILKTISAEGPEVAFVGARTLDQVRAKLSDIGARDQLKWRKDKFAFDKNG